MKHEKEEAMKEAKKAIKKAAKKAAKKASKAKLEKTRKTSGKAPLAGAPIDPETRHRMISEAAYYRAERRGFTGASPREDWAAAEAEIDRMLSGMQIR